MIKKLLQVRRNPFANLERCDKKEDYKVSVTLVRHDQFLGLLAMCYVGSLFLLMVAIYTASLLTFGYFLLSFAAASLFFAFAADLCGEIGCVIQTHKKSRRQALCVDPER